MSNPVPNALALTNIPDGVEAQAAPLRNNFSAIQTALNALRACLAGGTAGQALKAVDATDVQYGPDNVISDTVILNGTVSYTAPATAGKLNVEAVGAGGAGGGAAATGAGQGSMGGGGGGGAWARKLVTTNLGTHTVAVGTGSAGITNGSGPAGGDTSFKDSTAATVCLAKGGNGGTVAAANGASNGAFGGTQGSCVGDMALGGCPGGVGSFPGVGGLVATALGGAAARGGGGGVAITTAGNNGQAGALYGGGGGGGSNGNSQAGTQAGGAGAHGVLYVRALAP